MQRLVLLALGAATMGVSSAFVIPAPSSSCSVRAATTMNAEQQDGVVSRKEAVLGGVAVGALLLGSATAFPGAARAEFTPAQRKQQYFRYAPRIKKARDYFAGDLKKAIDAKDWKKVLAAFEPEAQAPEASLRNNPNRFINVFEKDLYNPMKIYAQSYSEKGASPRLSALLNAEARAEAAINRLQNVAKGDLKKPGAGGGGFLFGLVGGGEADAGADKYEGLSQEAMAKALWGDAKDALNEYFTTCNKIMGLELRQFDLI